MTAEQVADVIAGTKTLDVTQAVQNWIAACVAQHRACRAMPGIYRLSGPIVFEQAGNLTRSEEHTSELQSLMRNSYAVFCLKKKKTKIKRHLTKTINTQHP